MLKKIKLLGRLGKKFGREYLFDVASPSEAIKALCYQVKGFKQYMLEGGGRDQKFKIVVGNEALSDIDKQPYLETSQNISIVPIVKGAGGDFAKVVGIALVGIALFNPLGFAFASTLSGALTTLTVGVSLLIAGTAAKPDISPQETNRNDDRSYLFNGAVNTTQQGQPIPIGYGRMRIGSQVVSASLSTTQIAI